MATPVPLLVVLCREALGLNQAELAARVGASLRTVQRWETRRATPHAWDLHRLADAVRPHDADLASQLDVWAPRPGPPSPTAIASAPAEPATPPVLPAPALPPAPPLPPAVPAGVLVDSVVFAAAEAMSLSPQAIRPAVLAAFARARDAGLTLDAVVEVLAPPPTPEKGKPSRGK